LFNGNHYHGFFGIIIQNDAAYFINYIDLEEYVGCVLNSESWPGWPLELNKAFAIASRSYLVSKISQAIKRNALYHIKNTNIHQTYNGIHASETLHLAVNQTRGIILTHNQKAIEAMFDCCCGGIIPAKMTGIDFERAPYLARSNPCNYCKTSKLYTWKVEYPLSTFQQLLKKAGFPVRQLRDIKVTKRDGAGVVQQVMIRDARKITYLTGKQIYSVCSKIKSFCFTVQKKGKEICFTGKGYGHHLGICQWGARRMIDAGFTYRSILNFYYPGTTLMELKSIA
jgi:stage II sporulation protein D